jgi:hypothetical protein
VPFFCRWPFFCARWQRWKGGLPDDFSGSEYWDTEGASRNDDFVNMWGAEDAALHGSQTPVGLASLISEIRAHECSGDFISLLLTLFHKPASMKPGVQAAEVHPELSGDALPVDFHYSSYNSQYGTLYYSAFVKLLSHPALLGPISTAATTGEQVLVLGSNIGNEAFYAALECGLNIRAVELLCEHVKFAKELQQRHHVNELLHNASEMQHLQKNNGSDAEQEGVENTCTDSNCSVGGAPAFPFLYRIDPDLVAAKPSLQFECGDALKTAMAGVALVYIDNAAWDETITTQL